MGEKAGRSIVLIGMPGSGKSRLARLIAERSGMALYDTDEEIKARAGISIEAIFAEYGEARFREMEAAAIADCAACENAVIATGGGAVLLYENRAALMRCGFVVFISRALSRLDRAGRPLSKSLAALEALYAERLSLYRLCCDAEIDLGDAPVVNYDVAAEEILGMYTARGAKGEGSA